MYMQHFGLREQPFRAVALGDRVFVGPRQARALANLKIALAMPDAIVVVAGPVGVGKTTLVGRVLDLVATKRAMARVGRSPMTADEMLEHLLAEFGISGAGTGRMERLRTLRTYFKDCGATGVRAFILVEDAKALDGKLLAELESVTAADADGSPGANVILMGPAAVTDLVDAPELEHLRQRTRLRQKLEPLNSGEIAGYVKHQLEMAGGNFAAIVDPQTPQTLRHCTGGIPRIVNNLCETALTVAATNKMPTLLPHLVQRVAVTIYGIQPRAADGESAPVAPIQSMTAPAPSSDTPAAAPEATAGAPMADPEPTIVEEDLPEEMLEAAEALADFEPAHPGEVTQDITELPEHDDPELAQGNEPQPGDFLSAQPTAGAQPESHAQPPIAETPAAVATPAAATLEAAEPVAAELPAEAEHLGSAPDSDAAGEDDHREQPIVVDSTMSMEIDAALAEAAASASELTIDDEWGTEAAQASTAAERSASEPEPHAPIPEASTPAATEPTLQHGAAAMPLEDDDSESEATAVVLTESTRIKTLSVLDELADMEVAPAEPDNSAVDAPAPRSAAPASANIDWTTWPVAADADTAMDTDTDPTKATGEPALPTKPAPVSTPIEMATPATPARPTTRLDPVLAPVVGPAAGPARSTPPPARANSPQQGTTPAAPLSVPAAPPTLTDVQPEAPLAAAAPPPAPAAESKTAPPVLTEVFQVTPRPSQPAAQVAVPPPGPSAQPAVSATRVPAAPTAAKPESAVTAPSPEDLDFSVLLSSEVDDDPADSASQSDSDVPVIVDPPALKPVDGELQELASQVAQVTNLADLDELLAETLFGEAELEQLSAEIQAREETVQRPSASAPATVTPESRPAPPATGTDTTKIERMAILAAMNALGNDQADDESDKKNAVG